MLQTVGTWSRIPQFIGRPPVVAILTPALLMLVGILLYAPLLWGDMPVNHDHPMLLLRAWILGQQVATSGTPFGFSPILFAGNPADGLYSIGSDLLVGFFRLVTFGIASWETAYCWALLTGILAYPMALYALGHRLGGPLAGLVAGLLGLLDRGAYLQPGWSFTVDWGVWAMGLAFALCLWTVWALDRFVATPSRGRLMALAMLCGGALIGHPMSLPILGIVIPLQLLAHVLFTGWRSAPRWLPGALFGLLLGGGLSTFWYLPFLSHGAWFEPLGMDWVTLPEALVRLFQGQLLVHLAPIALFGGAIGLAWSALRRNGLALALVTAFVIMLIVSSSSFLVQFDVLAKVPAVGNLQMERFAYLLRSALILGVGPFVAFTWHLLRKSTLDNPALISRRSLARGLAIGFSVLLLAPIVGSLLWNSAPHLVPATNRLEYGSTTNTLPALRKVATYLRSLPESAVGRVMLDTSRHDHLPMMLPVLAERPIFKVGFTPENNYRFKPESADSVFQKALQISHVLSNRPRFDARFQEVARFEPYWVYRVRDFAPWPASMRGPGAITTLRDEPEALDFRLEGTGPDSEVVVHMANFALWQAEIDGDPVEITGAVMGDSPPMFMKMQARDGLLTLRYRAGKAEHLGSAVSIAALLGLSFLLILARSTRAATFWERWTERLRTPVARVVTIGCALIAAVALVAILVGLAIPRAGRLPGRTVVADLAQYLPSGLAEVDGPHGTVACQPWDGDRFQCPQGDWNYVGRTILTADGMMRDCVWMHPPAQGPLTLLIPDVPLGERLEGHYGLHDVAGRTLDRAPVRLRIAVDDQEPQVFDNPPAMGWHTWVVPTPGRSGTRGNVRLSTESPDSTQRHFCVTLFSTRDAP